MSLNEVGKLLVDECDDDQSVVDAPNIETDSPVVQTSVKIENAKRFMALSIFVKVVAITTICENMSSINIYPNEGPCVD